MSRIKSFAMTLLLWTLVGVAGKVVFMAFHHGILGDADIADHLLVLWHGLRLDVAVGAYLTAVPGLLLIASVWCHGLVLRVLWKAYMAIAALVCSLAYIANLGLYGYWGFPLDDTPLLYIRTSPADAMASMEWWQMVVVPLVIVAVAVLIYKLPFHLPTDVLRHRGKQIGMTALLVLMEAALLLPIRGGLGTGTNHTGSVYFSSNIRLDHAAVNPVFSFVESVLHREDIGTKYRFMPDEEATRLFHELTHTALRSDTTGTLARPNVILVVLESFSDTVMHIPGVTPRLVQLTHEGIHFTNFYASSFRTDRALLSIHSALPAQPTMSLMDIPRKSTSLPSIAGTLARNGYTTAFYYGGDVNYSNMRSYFMGTGFHRVISETDFSLSRRTGKWGVADGPVYERMLADIRARQTDKPFFMSIMTESSHEPFDVPEEEGRESFQTSKDNNRFADNKILHAFAYADDCLGRFVDDLKAMPCWKQTLLIVVPDHLGAFPDEVDNYQLWRYKQPLVITGGAVDRCEQCPVVGSQIDIAATLFGLLGIAHDEFTYSKDLLDRAAPHFAFFSFPDAMGMVTDSSSVIYDNTSGRVQAAEGPDTDMLVVKAKAYLQKLYDDLEKR